MKIHTAILAAALLVVTACHSIPKPGPEPLVFEEPNFVSVQTDLFGVAGSLSNAWGDVDNDGDLDFAVSLKGGEIRLYLQEDGVFNSVGPRLGLPQSGPEFRGLSWGDYDGDGYLDLFAGATMPGELSRLYHNNAGVSLSDVAADVGLTVPNRSARQSNWIDYDNDGDLDLYASDRIGTNKLFKNTNGKFSQVFAGEGPSDGRSTVGACWFDFNMDGRMDLFLANQSGDTDAMWQNNGSSFVDVGQLAGVDSPGRTKIEGGVGCAVGDYDNDGLLDIFMSAYGPNRLYKNNGNGSFSDVSEIAGIVEPDHVVGADWGDYDNDGDLDLFVAGYEGPRGEQTPVDMLYKNDGSGRFENILGRDDEMNAADHGVAWVDFDGDGDLDLSLTDGYGVEGAHFVFRNEMSETGRSRSLRVLILDGSGRFPMPGAEVRLLDKDGGVIASRMVTTGGGYNSQNAMPISFGLSDMRAVDIEVTYITSRGRVVTRVNDILPAEWVGRVLKIKPVP